MSPRIGPDRPLPISTEFTSPEQYVEELVDFTTQSDILTTLCGGVHVLDFFTREPDLYTSILPQSWRTFFAAHDIMDVLELLMRTDLTQVDHQVAGSDSTWKDGPYPPIDLIDYIRTVRRLSMDRSFRPSTEPAALLRNVSSGMNIKKKHEVAHFSGYISHLISSLKPVHPITHIVDLGSGQGYLPRALASPPYDHHLIAVESRANNIAGSKKRDIFARLAPKFRTLRDMKAWKAEREKDNEEGAKPLNGKVKGEPMKKGERGFFSHPGLPASEDTDEEEPSVSTMGRGSVQYIGHYLLDGDLSQVVKRIVSPAALKALRPSLEADSEVEHPLDSDERHSLPQADPSSVSALVISLHSCGNLLHHGLRSLLLTPQVSAVAMVGCCYNLLTERLGPPSVKIPGLRSPNARVEAIERAADPHGFPMSARLCSHPKPKTGDVGVRLNITARMMAVQAPQNWGREDSDGFFTRHFYRALLQRVFMDLGLIPNPWGKMQPDVRLATAVDGGRVATQEENTPVILGSLPARAYTSFVAYVRAAAGKLRRSEALHPSQSAPRGVRFADALDSLGEEALEGYERGYMARRKELSVVWSLMAFSAGCVEALIVADRWLWLQEQEEVGEAWVEAVWGYESSPRNLVVVGIKKGGGVDDASESGGGDDERKRLA